MKSPNMEEETSPVVEIVDAKIVKNRIKEACLAAGLTQEELARRVNVSYRHLNRITLNKSEPSLLLAARIGAILEVEPSQLFDVKVTTRLRVSQRTRHVTRHVIRGGRGRVKKSRAKTHVAA